MSNLDAPCVAVITADQPDRFDQAEACPACGGLETRVVKAPRRSSLQHVWCPTCHKTSAVLCKAPIPVW